MGHLGLTPQTATALGAAARRLLDDALALEAAGCFALVLEAVPAEVAAVVTELLEIPTIGIGAGPETDGQVLVLNDLLGLFEEFKHGCPLRPSLGGSPARPARAAPRGPAPRIYSPWSATCEPTWTPSSSPAGAPVSSSANRSEEALEPVGEPWSRGNEVPGTGGNHAFRAELGSERVADPLQRFGMVARGHERTDARVTQHVKGRSRFVWQPPPVCAANTARDVFRQRSIVDVRGSREAQELAQIRRVGAEALAKNDIAKALEAGDLRVVKDQVVKRRFDQRQGTHLVRSTGRCEKRPQHSIGVRDDVRARIEQRSEIGCVNLEVVTAWRTGRTGRITAPVHERKGPSGGQWRESRPGRARTCPTVNQQHFRALALAHHGDVIRPGHLAHTCSRRLVAAARERGIGQAVQASVGISDGERLWAVRYPTGGRSRTLFVSIDGRALRRPWLVGAAGAISRAPARKHSAPRNVPMSTTATSSTRLEPGTT